MTRIATLRAEFDALRTLKTRRPLTAAETRRLLALAPIVGSALL
jgi:hypothetical protein